jgi:transposase
MSGDTCSAFFKNLGFNQTKFEKFMKYILNKEDEQLAIDGTVISCASQKNDISYYGYNPHNLDQLQFKLLYVFNMKKNMPQYFEIIPGNVTDRSSLIPMVKQLNIANCTFVVDKGFSKSENYKEIVSNGNHFIIPAYKNSHLIKEQEELIFKFADVFAYSGKPIEYSLSVADKIGETEV